MPTTLRLGNANVVESFHKSALDPKVKPGSPEDVIVQVPREDLGFQVTSVTFPDGLTLLEKLADVGGLWPLHSPDPPEWVESDDEALAQLVAAQFTWEASDDRPAHTCKVGRPSGWKEG